MPRKKATEMSPAEWKVMKIVWELKESAIGDVLEIALQDHDWSRSTVKTLLRRLVDKGYVEAKRIGNSFMYRPKKSPMKSIYRALDFILDNAFEGTSGPILAYMIKKSDLTIEETRELQSMLEKHASQKGKKK